MTEPLGEQPIGSEGSSRPALRTYFVGDYFTGTPVNISELSGECWGGGEWRFVDDVVICAARLDTGTF